VRQLDHVERPPHPFLELGSCNVPDRKRKRDVFRDSEMRKEGIALEHHADVPTVRRLLVQPLACETDLAAARNLEAGEHHERGRLAGTRGSEKRQELAIPDIEGEIANDVDDPVVRLVDLRKGNERHRHTCSDYAPRLAIP
jgi:hypothetical protein